jgi:peptidoglycan/xylan/chitin deacetylase (PgdA/CDA1 family)
MNALRNLISSIIYHQWIPAPVRTLYYVIKPLIPRKLQLHIRRKRGYHLLSANHNSWPIDPESVEKPKGWKGWPGNKRFALVLTHDVEGLKGIEGVRKIAGAEKELGLRSSFNFVGDDYSIPDGLQAELTSQGFEIGVHGLHHNGMMFAAKRIFRHHAKGINECLKQWNANGFRAPSMNKNLEWIHDLNIRYDSSTFDTDPFEPQPDGIKTIFPLWIVSQEKNSAYVELPYTLAQDFTLFVILGLREIEIWKSKLDWIAEHGGMALLITHPDYMCWNGSTPTAEEYPAEYYKAFLEYVHNNYQGLYWNALPREAADYFASVMPSGLRTQPR